MNEKMHGQIGMNYSSYLTDVILGTISGVIKLDRDEFLSLHGQYVDYGTFQGTDPTGQLTGNFKAQDAALTVGYAKNLNDFFTIGANLKYINSTIETYSSNAVAADLGFVFHDIDYDTNLALSIRNIGFQITPYANEDEKLPFQINLGVSHKLENAPVEFNLTLHDLQNFNSSEEINLDTGQETGFGRELIDKVSVGAEIFPGKAFNLRIGYNFKRGNELKVQDQRNFSGLTYGFGFQVNSLRFEYAKSQFHTAANAHYFGVLINLDRILSGRNYYRYRR